MLLNLTNHPQCLWNEEQLIAARVLWTHVVDFPFPNVNPEWDEQKLTEATQETFCAAMALHPDAVLCQGEMSMTFLLIALFERQHIPCYTACSQRQSSEQVNADGTVEKRSIFRFVRFRRYHQLGKEVQ